MKVTLTVMISFDVDVVNNALGNTQNVGAREALSELLVSALSEYGSLDGYGDPNKDAPNLDKHVQFEVL